MSRSRQMATPPWADDPALDHTPGSLLKALLGGLLFVVTVWVVLILLFSAGPA